MGGIDAEEGGSYEAGLQGSLEVVTMPWAGRGDGRHISRSEEVLTRRRLKLQGEDIRVVPGDNIRLGGSIQSRGGGFT